MSPTSAAPTQRLSSFPTIAKAGFIVGGSYGKGRLTPMLQRLLIQRARQQAPLQLAEPQPVQVVEKHHATTKRGYRKGMAVFTVAKGGLMFEASIGGQKFSYTPLKK